MVGYARIGIFFFALCALIFALMSSDELVLLARTSFAGTSLLAPMIFTGIFHKSADRLPIIPIATLIGIIIFVGSLLGVIPNSLFGIRVDLLILAVLTIIALVAIQLNKKSHQNSQV